MFLRKFNLVDYSIVVFCIDKKQYEEEMGALNDNLTSKNPLGSLENTQKSGMYYNIGIVDYLQPYNLKKRLKKVVKKVQNLKAGTENSQKYSDRFIKVISTLIDEEKQV